MDRPCLQPFNLPSIFVHLPTPSYTYVKYVVPTTVPNSALTRVVPLSKPTPWIPLRLFILACQLSDHPDQAFVKQLINDLYHGCFIGYKGLQFSYCTNNLVSTYQHPTKLILSPLYKRRMYLRTISVSSPAKFPDIGTGLSPKTRCWVENHLPFICIAIHKY